MLVALSAYHLPLAISPGGVGGLVGDPLLYIQPGSNRCGTKRHLPMEKIFGPFLVRQILGPGRPPPPLLILPWGEGLWLSQL